MVSCYRVRGPCMDKNSLLERLKQVAESVKNTGDALAFLALGSVGKETQRIDEFSDLDFFVICKEDKKDRFIRQVDWLTAIRPAAFYFQNTRDGLKFVFEDGILCEFAIFTETEFRTALYSEGRFLWKDDAFQVYESTAKKEPEYLSGDEAYFIGEALTNLYVGMGRYLRGEKMSAFSFVQNYAVHHVLSLICQKFPSEKPFMDVFNTERRFEIRYSRFSNDIAQMTQGYNHTPESAEAILNFLNRFFRVNVAMSRLIASLIDRARK